MMCLANKRFPCGHCYACRFNKMQEKAMRINHELQYHEDSVFITLTYSPENLPKDKGLVKSDAQKFLKRLRKRLGVDRVRYYLCGEYGDSGKYDGLGHPHYHMIIFGLSYNDSRIFKDLKWIPSKGVWYCSCDCWRKGFVTVGKVIPARVNYVARYCMKKLNGDVAEEIYKGRQPEFCLASKCPGLGFDYAQDHLSRLVQDGYCTVKGRQHAIPRYYVEKLFSPTDKITRAHKRDDICKKLIEEKVKKHGPYNSSYTKYSRYLEDCVETAKQIIAKRLQVKGKTKCPIG